MQKKKVIIMGAGGRDFHNFNVYFRDNNDYEVMAFTATQIPGIEGRTYPPELAGKYYPAGIPIYSEADLPRLLDEQSVDEVVFAYSDVSHQYVMHRASLVLAAGADFRLMGTRNTMLESTVPVVSVGAVRTGSGKSQTARRVTQILKEQGYRVVVMRHPMPYGDLRQQSCQRFATYADLERYECSIEEREEYEPHLEQGTVVYAGVDYREILRQAEAESGVIVWDGGNNDLPFIRPDIHIVVADPLRPGHEITYHPGEANLRLATVVVINKVDTASPESVAAVRESIHRANPAATIIEAASPVSVDRPQEIKRKRVLIVEDGPTLTHGEMSYGAGMVAAKKFGAREIIDPRSKAVGSIIEAFAAFPQIGPLLPAVGYSKEQIRDLEETINAIDCDVVIIATPVDLRRLIHLNKPMVRVRYELQELSHPNLADVLQQYLGHRRG
ncbi:MAG: cyclic 2,3-diphosphoglycerate synthase [Chloroflexi bacterium]|nr:cyclic 2,3-diphosphoglycerate synthase [Chloroflexota bacterium]MCL5074116.1 cyclic 2,3-diphosphoglycerate synthase [Chloroflexota bacterium]